VLPLLWNMLVAIRIWTKLKRSIPPGLRNHYSLIPDPTAGKVTIVARIPTLEIPGLWSTSPPNFDPAGLLSEKKEPYSQLHRSIAAMGMPLIAPSTAMMARMATRKNKRPMPLPLRIGRQYLLGRTWMSLVDQWELELKKPHHGDSEDREDPSDEEDVRFVVANDMKASERTPLKMDWAQFVWLALALGISAYDPTWQSSYPCTFKNDKNEDLVHLSYEDDRLFAKFALRGELTYSLQRAFAWHNIKLDGDRLLPLGYCEAGHVCLNSVTISPGLSARRLGMNLGSKGYSSTIRGREPQDCNNPLAAASCWLMYWRRHCLRYGEVDKILPVSQHLLEYRQRVLCHLNSLDDNNMLATKVRSLFRVRPIDDVAAQQTSETIQPHLGVSQRFATTTEVTEDKEPVEDAPLIWYDQKSAEAILRQLRFKIESSEYVQKHVKLCKYTKTVESTLLLKKALKNSPSIESIKLWRQAQDQVRNEPLLTSHQLNVLEPRAGESIKRRVPINERDLYGATSWQLRAEFDSAVQSWASDPESQGASRWDAMDGAGLLACVALALADWDTYERKEWRVRDEWRTALDQINELIFDLVRDKPPKRKRGFGRADELEHLLRHFSTNILEMGLYTAPEKDPVARLFHAREKHPVVYLI
jgi:hypothetical protein